MRRSSRKAEVTGESLANLAAVDGHQEIAVEMRAFKTAFNRLPAHHREALVLVGASGFSYEEAAHIAGCPIGTIRSRVSRARQELQKQLYGVESPEAWKRVAFGRDRSAHSFAEPRMT